MTGNTLQAGLTLDQMLVLLQAHVQGKFHAMFSDAAVELCKMELLEIIQEPGPMNMKPTPRGRVIAKAMIDAANRQL